MSIGSVMGFSGVEGSFDGIDIFIIEVGNFNIGMDFGGLGGKMFVNVRFEFIGNWGVGELDIVLDIRVVILLLVCV